MKYFLKQAQFSPKSVASSWHGRENGMLYQVAVVETGRLFTIFDNQQGWQVTPFPTHFIFAGDKFEGLQLLKSRYDITYQTPEKKRGMHP